MLFSPPTRNHYPSIIRAIAIWHVGLLAVAISSTNCFSQTYSRVTSPSVSRIELKEGVSSFALRDLISLAKYMQVESSEAEKQLIEAIGPIIELDSQSTVLLTNAENGGGSGIPSLGGKYPRARIVDSVLYVLGTERVRQEVGQKLEQLLQEAGTQVSIQVRFLTMPKIFADELAGDWRLADLTSELQPSDSPSNASISKSSQLFQFHPTHMATPPKIIGEVVPAAFVNSAPAARHNSRFHAQSLVETNLPVLYAVLKKEATDALVTKVQRNSRLNVLQAPKVTLFHQQTVSIQDTKQRPFIVGIKPRSSDPKVAQVPVIKIVEEGITIGVRPVLLGHSIVQLECEIVVSAVRAVREVELAKKGKNGISIQAPEVAKTTIQTSIEMPLESTLAIQCGPSSPEQNLMLLLKCERIEL